MKKKATPAKEETLQERWIDYVKKWNKERFGKAEYLGGQQKTLHDTKKYLVAIDDLLGEERTSFPIESEYSSEGKTELETLVYLVNESANALDSKQEGWHTSVCSIIYDGFNISYGKEGLLEILSKYIKWSDINKSA